MEGLENYGIDEEKLNLLKDFVMLMKTDSSLLSHNQLKFFKNWLVNDLGAKIPNLNKNHSESSKEENTNHGQFDSAAKGDAWTTKAEQMEEDEDSSEFEDDMEGVVVGDKDEPQEMGDITKEVTDEIAEQANSMKFLGIEALNNGDCEGAIKHFTSGIVLDCTKTILFIKRATAYLRLSPPKPNAAIRDAKKAVEINPDSAAAYKVLGKAQRLLGKWEEACHHLEEAQKIDFDDNVVELLKEIKPKANRIREHKLRKERKKKDREIEARRKKAESIRKAQEQARKDQEKRDRENLASSFNFAEGANSFTSDADDEKEDDGPKIQEMEDDLD